MIQIPTGLATKLGLIGTTLLGLAALLTPLLEGQDGGDAKFYAALSTLIATATLLGRMAQSAAALRDAPSPGQTGDITDPGDWSDDDLEPQAPVRPPAEEDLTDHYQEDAPGISGKAGEQ